MRRLLYILKKEFLQIFRDKMIPAIIFSVAVVQMLLLPWAADLDVRNLKVVIIDLDKSTLSSEIISRISASESFKIVSMSVLYEDALGYIERNKADMILTIPADFSENLLKEHKASLSVVVNAINGVKAGLGTNYLISVILDRDRKDGDSKLKITHSAWFNPEANYRFYMVPAILVLLMTIVAGFLTSLNIVKEKEIGTIEQINVTPMKKWQFIIGKLLPFFVIGTVIFSIGCLIAYFVYGIRIEGSIGVLFLFNTVYLIAILGFGLLISTTSRTQQQAMFVAFFFIMIFLLMSGLFTGTDNMPVWAGIISKMIPLTYYMEAVRSIMLKGSTFNDLMPTFLWLVGFAIVLNIWAVLLYKKRA